MHGPAVVSWLLVTMCAATGMYCLMLSGRGTGAARSTARTEAVMGLGMAAMALPAGAAAVPPAAFVALFGVAALWSLRAALSGSARPGRPRAGGHRAHGLHHALEALAMAYMGLVMLQAGTGGPHPGHGTVGGVPAVTGGLLVYFAAFALHTGVRMLPVAVTGAGPAAAAAGDARPPGVAHACRLTLALGSFTMLLTL